MLIIGAAGWSYDHWRGSFYPRKTKNMLEYYSKSFSFVEVNSTFYSIPSESTVESWFRKTPSNFIFSAKLLQAFTHNTFYHDVDHRYLETFFTRLRPLREKLRVIVVQFPKSFVPSNKTKEYLNTLVEEIKTLYRGIIAIELRNLLWLEERDYVIHHLRDEKVTLVQSDRFAYNLEEPDNPTYIRLLGDRRVITDEDLGTKRINRTKELRRWAYHIAELLRKHILVYLVINNHYSGNAIDDLLFVSKFVQKMGEKVIGPKHIMLFTAKGQKSLDDFF